MPLTLPTNRRIQDALLTVSAALPAANANNNQASIDLGQVTAFPINEVISVELSVPATPNLADGQTLTYTLQDSADNVTFATLVGHSTSVSTGAGGVGAAALSRIVKLFGTTRRYIRWNAAASATAGSNIAVSYTNKVLT